MKKVIADFRYYDEGHEYGPETYEVTDCILVNEEDYDDLLDDMEGCLRYTREYDTEKYGNICSFDLISLERKPNRDYYEFSELQEFTSCE